MPPHPVTPSALALLAALSGPLTAAATTPPAQALPHSDSPPPARVDRPARPRDAARARVVLPQQVRRGTLLVGQAPPGSQASIDGTACPVDSHGQFAWPVPLDAAGPLTVRIVRPDGRTLRLRVQLEPAR